MPPKKKGAAKSTAVVDPIITGDQALQLKGALDAGQPLDNDTLLTLLHADTPCEGLYSKTCKSKGRNPNCFCNLIPDPTKSRRSGLWALTTNAEKQLGPDPTATKKEDAATPAGLRNLGNTCYVNSVLQCLFANEAFRDAIYAAAPPVSDDAVVKAMRELFVQMQHGPLISVDPTPLATALQLNHSEQQDGQEFMKLLLTLLEHRFAGQPALRGAIQSLFRGQSGYETVCLECQTASESSSRFDHFYELGVPVRGFKSLDESLTSLLSPEILDGPNQFSCERCGGKRDATRRLRVRSLPPLFCLSLQRFVYDVVKGNRVKATDKFAFPLELKAAAVMGGGDAEGEGADAVYDLEAILIHKGGSATHGHYVAHIKLDSAPDGSGGSWWRFDDENVSKMEDGPLGSADHGGAGTAAATKKKTPPKGAAAAAAGTKKKTNKKKSEWSSDEGEEKGGATKKKPRRKKAAAEDVVDDDEDVEMVDDDDVIEIVDDDGDDDGGNSKRKKKAAPKPKPKAKQQQSKKKTKKEEEIEAEAGASGSGQQQQQKKKQSDAAKEIVSSNAYMLVYRRRGEDVGGGNRVALDAEALQWINYSKQRLSDEFSQQCATYTAAKAEAEAQQAARRQNVREIVESIGAGIPDDDPGKFISSTWLQSWADAPASEPSAPIDNAPLLCPHGRLDPSRPAVMKRVPTHAWAVLQASCGGGGPELSPSDACAICLGEALAAIAAAEDSSTARGRYLSMAAELLHDDASVMAKRTGGGGGGGGGGGDDDGIGGSPAAFYVSKSWLAAWLKREGRSMGTITPTTALECPHGGLAPETGKGGKKRIAIPADFWAFLQRSWLFSEAERVRKEAAKVAERMRKVQGGAAVLGGGGGHAQQHQQRQQSKSDDDIEVVEVDGEKMNSTHTTTAATAATDAAEEIEIEIDLVDSKMEEGEVEEEEEEGKGGGSGSGSGSKNKNEKKGRRSDDDDDDGSPRNNGATTTSGPIPLTEFPVPATEATTHECAICRAEMEASARLTQSLQHRLAAEKHDLASLLAANIMQLVEGGVYCLVPHAFMDHWRAYMYQTKSKKGSGGGGGGNFPLLTSPGAVLDPPVLSEYMSRALCDCHKPSSKSNAAASDDDDDDDKTKIGPLLAFPPPMPVNKRGRWQVSVHDGSVTAAAAAAEDPTTFFEVVTQSDYLALVEHYHHSSSGGGGGGGSGSIDESLLDIVENGITATLRVEHEDSAVDTTLPSGGGGAAAASSPKGKKSLSSSLAKNKTTTTSPPLSSSSPSPRKREKKRGSSASTPSPTAKKMKTKKQQEDDDAAVAAALQEELDQPTGGGARISAPRRTSTRRASTPERQTKEEEQQEQEEQDDVDHKDDIFGDYDDYAYERKPTRSSTRCGGAGAGAGVWTKAWFETEPAVCAVTVQTRADALRAARLTYFGAEVMVGTCHTDEEAIAATEVGVLGGGGIVASSVGVGGGAIGGLYEVGGGGGGERKSKRARKGRAPVTVDCTTTLYELKLRIFESLNVHPKNARLFIRGKQLLGNGDDDFNGVTLAGCEIFPLEEIRVVDTGEHDPDDLEGLFASSGGKKGGGSGGGGRRGGVEGFGGTALTGLHPNEAEMVLAAIAAADAEEAEMIAAVADAAEEMIVSD